MLKKKKNNKHQEIEVLSLDEETNNKTRNKKKKAKKKSTKKSTKKFTILTILLVMLLAILGIFFFFFNTRKEDKPKKIETTEPEETIKKYSFSFIGVGDALLHPGVYMDAATNNKDSAGYTAYDFHHMFAHIADAIKGYDLKYYNQETIIGGKNLGLSGYPCFNSPEEIGLDMMDIGFNVVSLATNHTMDKGTKGATHSAEFWHTKSNVLALGSYRSAEERNTPVVKEVNGIKYAILNYTYGTNGITVPSGYEYLVNVWPMENDSKYQAYKAVVKKDVEAVKDKADVVMVAMHWGTEYQVGKYNSYQRDAAEYLSSLGVKVIIGTHPHVVQPIEYINDTLVIYSLGNFVSGQTDLMKKIGGIAAFTINKTVENGNTKIDISDVKADLLYTYHQNYHNYSIIPFEKLNDTILYNYRSTYEQYKKYLNPGNDSRIQVGFIK